MREILFRGKRVDNGKWMKGSLVDYRPHYQWMHINYFSKGDDGFLTRFEAEVVPETVGQYTGLKDKNGKKIFEGDIVKDDSISLLGDVVFSTVGIPSFGINDVHDGLQYHDSFWHELEIVGNIHDNPELLENP